jgi:hypothetical protein
VRLTAPIHRVAASSFVSSTHTFEGLLWPVELVTTATTRPPVSGLSVSPTRSTGRYDTM